MTRSEFAKRCGVSPAAITQAVEAGSVKIGKTGRIDPAHMTNLNYYERIKSRISPGAMPKKNGRKPTPGTEGWTKTDADIAKANAQTAKIHMEIAQRMGALLLTEEVDRCFGDIYGAFSNHVLTFGQRMAPVICSSLDAVGVEAVLRVQKILDDEHERILEDVRRATVEGLESRKYKPVDNMDEDDE
jgi:hypothetical protein